MKVTVEPASNGKTFLVFDHESRTNDYSTLKAIEDALTPYQHGSSSIQGRLIRISIPITPLPFLGPHTRRGQ